jgi:hypothetical protein
MEMRMLVCDACLYGQALSIVYYVICVHSYRLRTA